MELAIKFPYETCAFSYVIYSTCRFLKYVSFEPLGYYLQAELLFERALEIDEKNYGPDSVMITAKLTNLAFLYKEQGQYEKAEPYFKRPLEIYEKTFPNGHPQTLEYMKNLASFYWAAHRTQEAEDVEQHMQKY